MKVLLILVVLLAGCGTTEPHFAAYEDGRVLVVVVSDGDSIRQEVLFHDYENQPAYRVVTGPLSELDVLMLSQGAKVDE